MSAIAAMIETSEGGHFDEVVGAVQKMLQELREEENDDIKLKDYCRLEEDKAHNEVEDLEHKQTNQQGALDRLDARKKEFSDDSIQAGDDIKETEAALAQALETRNKENEAYRAALKDDVDAVALLKSAIESLSAFYRDNKLPLELVSTRAAVAQKKPEYDEDSAPENSSFDKPYKGREGGGIISILTYLKEDIENEIITTRQAESRAQSSFIELRSKGQSTIGALKAKIVNLQRQIAEVDEATTDLQGEKKETKSLQSGKEAYIEALKPKCDWIKADFDSRREKRNEEMDGLQEAKGLLAGGTQQFIQVARLRGVRAA